MPATDILKELKEKLERLKRKSTEVPRPTTEIANGLNDVESDCTSALAALTPPNQGTAGPTFQYLELTPCLNGMYVLASAAYLDAIQKDPDEEFQGDCIKTIQVYIPIARNLNH